MKRLILAAVCALSIGQPLLAQSIDERIAASLQAEGYQIITMSRTWLGRIYVIAETDAVRREMVFNPATGEVLRDYAVTKGPAVSLADRSGNDSDRGQPTVAGSADGPTASVTTTREDDPAVSDDATIAVDPDGAAVIVTDPVIVP